MSRIAKWKIEKAKVKVVFRLQFHATHIPQSGWEKLFISFIPADSGKATAKTTKANVRNGTCKWADPIYESTRLLQDSKTKRYDEKIYKLVVAMGSSRSSLLGEANINLADYADALKPYVVSLPLHGTDSGTILHVTVQLLTSKTGFREFEQQREVRERRLLNADQNSHDDSAGGKVLSSEETLSDQMDKADAKVRFKSESKEQTSHEEEEAGFNEDYTDSAVGFDGSSNTSESLYAEKHETSSPHEIDSTKSTISGDLGGHSLSQSPQPEKGDPSDHQFHGWGSDYSMDNDLASTYEETNRLKGCLEVAESSIIELKMEVNSLQSHSNEIGVETQKFMEQIAAEVASGEELVKEVSLLKSECLKFKNVLEGLMNSKLGPQISSGETISTNSNHLFQDLQFRWLKGLLVVEDNLRALQNKACFGSHEGDFRFLHPDFEALLGILQDLKQGTGENISDLTMVPSERAKLKIRDIGLHENDSFASKNGFDADFNQAENIAHCSSITGMVSHEPDFKDVTNSLNVKHFELLRDLDQSKAERESLIRKMDQMEYYYEVLIQELEGSQKQMLGELQSLRNEHSTCHYTISSAKAQIETVHQDMNEQISRFAEDRQELESLNKELERRAITSEAALKRARLNYSIAVDQLQKDLGLLSFQVSSMFETNENLIRQTYAEESQPSFQGYVGMARSHELDSNQSDGGKLLNFQNQNAGGTKQSSGGDILLEDWKKSLNLQEELYKKVEEELCEMHVVNMQLDVFSKTLQETLLQAVADIELMKERIFELTQQLELSNKSEELLMQRLHNAMDDVNSLNEYKGNCIVRYNGVTLQNQKLEAELVSVTRENFLLKQKTVELDAVVEECRSYESKFRACAAEKIELENLLKQESLENDSLQNEFSSLEKEMETFKTEFKELASAKENLHKILDFLQVKLDNLLASYDKKSNGKSSWSNSLSHNLELKDFIGVISQLEELQHSASGKILQLMEVKKDLEEERDVAQASLKNEKSEILMIKQKFEHDTQGMVNKLDVSNALVQELQLELDAIANKLNVRYEAEEKYMQQNTQLSSDLAHLEVELEQITSQNKDLAGEISVLEPITEELGRCKLTISEFTQQNQNLIASLQDKTDESVKLVLELNNLKEGLKGLQDELHIDRENRSKLEGLVADLSHDLTEKNEQVLQFDRQEAEIVRFKQLASDLESKKSRVCSTHMESQLSEMHGLLIAADVEAIFTRIQYEAWIEELAQKLESSDKQLRTLHKDHFDVHNRLSQCLVSEKQCTEENAKLPKILEPMKSDLDSCVNQNGVLSDLNSATVAELEEYRHRAAALEIGFLEVRNQHVFEVEQLKHMLAGLEEEIDNLIVSNVEQETKVIVLEAKLDEQHGQSTFLEENNNKMLMLQNQCNELTHKLSEQTLKTEEFKNLSIHLRELKDKADACVQACGKRESEGPSVAMQESLRIAFIREQYETKLQELRHQISISKRHGEEMLCKLQDAVDEIESRKKSEASHLKRNEELSLKILELEGDLHSVLSDKCDKIKAYDQLKAEMECSLITLECSKEERLMLEASLQECNKEKSKITDELKYMKELLEGSTSLMNVWKEGSNGSQEVEFMPRELVTQKVHEENPITTTSNRRIITRDVVSENGLSGNLCEEVDECSTANRGEGHPNAFISKQSIQGVNGNPRLAPVDQENFLYGDAKQLALINDHFKARSLKSSMERLHKELERMVVENSFSSENNLMDPNFQGLQRELTQLHKVNEELGNIFPLFKEFPVNGNALERVLALEIELADALQSKNKSSIQFQSSFLKQHSNEEAIFQSFRDINELIEDMLEIKGRNAAVENELKEMHDRYSQLSLRFAEVEGERQKLMMTPKGVRALKTPLRLNYSSSDHSAQQQ